MDKLIPRHSAFSPIVGKKRKNTRSFNEFGSEEKDDQFSFPSVESMESDLKMKQMKQDNEKKEEIIRELHVHVEGLLRYKKSNLEDSKKISFLENQLMGKDEELTKASRKISTLQSQSFSLENQFGDIEREKEESRRKIGGLNSRLQNLLEEFERSEETKNNLEQQVEGLREQIREAHVLQKRTEKDHERMGSSLNNKVAACERKNVVLSSKVDRVKQENVQLRENLNKKIDLINDLLGDKERMESKLRKGEEMQSVMSKQLRELEEDFTGVEREAKKAGVLEGSVEKLRFEKESVENDLNDERATTAELGNEISVLKEERENLEEALKDMEIQRDTAQRETLNYSKYERMYKDKVEQCQRLEERIDAQQLRIEKLSSDRKNAVDDLEAQSVVLQDNLTRMFKCMSSDRANKDFDVEALDDDSSLSAVNNILLVSFKDRVLTLLTELESLRDKVSALERDRSRTEGAMSKKMGEVENLCSRVQQSNEILEKQKEELEKMEAARDDGEEKRQMLVDELEKTKKFLLPIFQKLAIQKYERAPSNILNKDEVIVPQEPQSWDLLKLNFQDRVTDLLSELEQQKTENEILASKLDDEQNRNEILNDEISTLGDETTKAKLNISKMREDLAKSLQLKDMEFRTQMEMEQSRVQEAEFEKRKYEHSVKVVEDELKDLREKNECYKKGIRILVGGLHPIISKAEGLSVMNEVLRGLCKSLVTKSRWTMHEIENFYGEFNSDSENSPDLSALNVSTNLFKRLVELSGEILSHGVTEGRFMSVMNVENKMEVFVGDEENMNSFNRLVTTLNPAFGKRGEAAKDQEARMKLKLQGIEELGFVKSLPNLFLHLLNYYRWLEKERVKLRREQNKSESETEAVREKCLRLKNENLKKVQIVKLLEDELKSRVDAGLFKQKMRSLEETQNSLEERNAHLEKMFNGRERELETLRKERDSLEEVAKNSKVENSKVKMELGKLKRESEYVKEELEKNRGRMVELENSKKRYQSMVKELNRKYIMTENSRYVDSDHEDSLRGEINESIREVENRRRTVRDIGELLKVHNIRTPEKPSFSGEEEPIVARSLSDSSRNHQSLYPILNDLESSQELVERLSVANKKATVEMKRLDKSLSMIRSSMDNLSEKVRMSSPEKKKKQRKRK